MVNECFLKAAIQGLFSQYTTNTISVLKIDKVVLELLTLLKKQTKINFHWFSQKISSLVFILKCIIVFLSNLLKANKYRKL